MIDPSERDSQVARLLRNLGADALDLSKVDPHLLEKAAFGLESLKQLSSNPANQQTVDESAVTLHSQDPTAARQSNIGRFQVKHTLGVGGHGIVLLAFDPKLERDVAIKIPNVDAAMDRESRQRFHRESRAAGILSHPAIVPVFESGSLGPVSYIVYRYCPGFTLASWQKSHSLIDQPRYAATIVMQLAEALEHAHQRGVIHRDLKPSNILLETQSTLSELKPQHVPACLRIADFGLAKFETDQLSLSRTQGVVGTPAYMSPEQAEGHSEITSASDIYSLGIILYELIAGSPPHRKDSVLATLRSITNDPITNPRRCNSKVSQDLAAICMKCLEKQPADRYASAFQLAEDLRAFGERRAVSVRNSSPLRRVEKWMRRNPNLVRATAFSLLISLIVLAVALNWVNNARYKESLANQMANDNLRRARGIVTDFFVMTESELENLPSDAVIRRRLAERSVHHFEEFEKIVDRSDRAAVEDLAFARFRLGQIVDSDNRFTEAIDYLNQALQEYRRLQTDQAFTIATQKDRRRYRLLTARIHISLGSAHTNQKQFDTGEHHNSLAIEQLQELAKQKSTWMVKGHLINALIDRGTILTNLRRTKEAQQVQQETLSLISEAKRTPELQRKQAFVYLEMAKTCSACQQLNQALRYFQKSRGTFEQLAAGTESNQFIQLMMARCDARIVNLRNKLGLPNEQTLRAQRKTASDLQRLAEANPERLLFQYEYALSLFELANFNSKKKDLTEAIRLNKQVIRLVSAIEDQDLDQDATRRTLLGGAYNNLASNYMREGKRKLAEDALRAAIPQTRAAIASQPNNLSAQRFFINHHHGLGEVLAAGKKYSEAIDVMGDAIALAYAYCQRTNAEMEIHYQLHGILGSRIGHLIEHGTPNQALLDNLELRIEESLFLLDQEKHQDYYQRELRIDIARWIQWMATLDIVANEKFVERLTSHTQHGVELKKLMIKTIEEREANEKAGTAFLQSIHDVLLSQ